MVTVVMVVTMLAHTNTTHIHLLYMTNDVLLTPARISGLLLQFVYSWSSTILYIWFVCSVIGN